MFENIISGMQLYNKWVIVEINERLKKSLVIFLGFLKMIKILMIWFIIENNAYTVSMAFLWGALPNTLSIASIVLSPV